MIKDDKYPIDYDMIAKWYGEVSIQARNFYDNLIRLEQFREESLNKISDLSCKLSKAESELVANNVAKNRVTELQSEINNANRKLTELQSEINNANRKLTEKDAEIARMKSEMVAMEEQNQEHIARLEATQKSKPKRTAKKDK